MTWEELNERYHRANRLIAKRSAAAAGKALTFSTQGLDEVTQEIAEIYGLGADEVASIQPAIEGGMMDGLQKIAGTLFGDAEDPDASKPVRFARTAIRNGQAAAMLATLVKAGPKAAAAAAAGGGAAAKATPWGWMATAAYAAGTAGWFAYNARSVNLLAFELVRQREGIELADTVEALPPTDGPDDAPVTLPAKVTAAAAGLAAQAGKLGGRLGGAASGASSRFRRKRC